MTPEQPWVMSPRPPTLEIPDKFNAIGSFLNSDLSSANAGGTLSPDIRLNSIPLFGVQSPICPAASVLRVGNYLLTKRHADMPYGINVYHAVHINNNEHCVCRVVPLNRCQSLLSPYTVVASHPNIDDVREIVMGATCAYVMHDNLLTCSEDLHAYVRRRRRLPEPEAALLFKQVLAAVVHCHRHGVVIRDIKLRRFLFADETKMWLKLDGLYDAAVFDGSNDQLNDKHGCLAYVSPEILDATFCGVSSAAASLPASSGSVGGSYSGRAADMWSAGVMLYTMLIGRYPFADADACALFSRIRRGRYPMPVDVSLSPSARCLIRSLLTVKTEDRLTAEEAIRHPWFNSESGQHRSTAAVLSEADDGVVPDVNMDVGDYFSTE